MTVLVTGSTGFIGHAICRQLVERGIEYQSLRAAPYQDLDLRDARAVRDRVCQLRPSAIVHAAGSVDKAAPAEFLYALHPMATLNLLEAAAAARSVHRFLSIGSAAEYGVRHQPEPIRETAPIEPESAYGISKALAGSAVQMVAAREGIAALHVRLFNPFGVRQRAGSFAYDSAACIAAALAKKISATRVATLSHADDVRDFLPIEDAAERVVALLTAEKATGAVNVCSGQGTQVNDAFRWIAEGMGFRGEIRTSAGRGSGRSCSVGSTVQLTRWIGPRKEMDIEAGFRRVGKQFAYLFQIRSSA